MTTLKVSPHGSFKVTQVSRNIAICEAINGDRNNWGNATDTEPAFIAYIGCDRDNAKKICHQIANRCESCEIRTPKYLKEFESEIKIKGLKRSDLIFLVHLN